ncbi:hypothetical protein STRDD11_01643 [Streptococcus sp. DD11]|nr:hypothetical protein STRDD11_01643 [Streptococcus sp. DD11]
MGAGAAIMGVCPTLTTKSNLKDDMETVPLISRNSKEEKQENFL